MFRGSARDSHRTKLWGKLLEAQISAKMEKMKSGIGRERPHSKKPKRVETEGNSEERKRVDAKKEIQSKTQQTYQQRSVCDSGWTSEKNTRLLSWGSRTQGNRRLLRALSGMST